MTTAFLDAMTCTEQTDIELVRLMLGGDREAFTELYRRRHTNVYRFVLHMGGAAELAEDITQEVFMALMNAGDAYDERRGSVNAFLLGIARNQVLRRLKKQRPLVAIEEIAEQSMTGRDEQLDALCRNEAIQSVQRAVLSLPEHYREVVVLCDLQEMSYVEAAAVLDCAVGTVRSRLHRGRVMLSERLRPADSESVTNKSLKSAGCFA